MVTQSVFRIVFLVKLVGGLHLALRESGYSL